MLLIVQLLVRNNMRFTHGGKAVVHTSTKVDHTVRYLSLHLALMLVSSSLAALYWHSFVLNSCFLFACAFGSVWNGAGFVFSYMVKRYEKKIQHEFARPAKDE